MRLNPPTSPTSPTSQTTFPLIRDIQKKSGETSETSETSPERRHTYPTRCQVHGCGYCGYWPTGYCPIHNPTTTTQEEGDQPCND